MAVNRTMSDIASDFANAGFSMGRDLFLKQMKMMHRTEQQMFAGLIISWIQDYTTYNTDDRNKYSVEYFTRMLDAFKTANPDEPLRKGFPLI